MARDIIINGETLVKVQFGAHLSGRLGTTSIGLVEEPDGIVSADLGLGLDSIRVQPRLQHMDIPVNDFGPTVPAEVLWMLADCWVDMTLVHYDKEVLDLCVDEAGAGLLDTGGGLTDGTMQGAGVPLGGGTGPLQSGCHYVTVNLTSPQLKFPYRFRTAYLVGTPLEVPLGTTRTAAVMRWRSLPYTVATVSGALGLGGPEIRSRGTNVFDRVE